VNERLATEDAELLAILQGRPWPPLPDRQPEPKRRREPETEPVPAIEPPKIWTHAELMATEFPEPRCIVEGLLPEGLTVLAGKPKIGKSWLALQLVQSVASGAPFLGHDTMQGPALYLALEDSPRRLKSRLQKQDAGGDLPIRYITEWPRMDNGGLTALEAAMEELQPAVVIIDTLTRCRSPRIDENSTEVASVVADLQALAQRQGCAIVVVHHHRKGTGVERDDPLDALRGSSAIGAAADCVWSVFRERGEREATLALVSRDLEEIELRVRFDSIMTYAWQLVGDERELAKTEAEQGVLGVLEILGEATAGDVAKEVGKTRVAVRATLNELVGRGVVGYRTTSATSKGGGRKVLYYLVTV